MRLAAAPSPNGFTACAMLSYSAALPNSRCAQNTICVTSVPTNRAVPAAMASGRSVVGAFCATQHQHRLAQARRFLLEAAGFFWKSAESVSCPRLRRARKNFIAKSRSPPGYVNRVQTALVAAAKSSAPVPNRRASLKATAAPGPRERCPRLCFAPR